MKSPIPVKKILAADTPARGLRHLIKRAEALASLNARLQQLLPQPMAQHCSVATLDRSRLVIVTSSPVWATRLRLLQPKIIHAFRDFRINSVTAQVIPANEPEPAPAPRPRQAPSPEAARLLSELADSASDPHLKRALRHLATRGGAQG